MKRKHRTNGTNEVIKVEEGGVKHEIRKSSGGVKLGDLIWVKLYPSSWWPAQVVDADTVSELIKPSERSVGEVLVRVYGSYLYLYVDPLESRIEFDKILKLYNGNYDQILEESLGKDLPHPGKSKGPEVSEATQSIGEVRFEKFFDRNPEEENNTQGSEDDYLAGLRASDNVPEQKDRTLCSGTNNKSRKKNTTMAEKESFLQRRVSPRRKLACNKLKTIFKNGNLKSEVSSTTGAEKSCPTKQKLHSQTTENETEHLDSENTGKVDNDLSIPRKVVIPIGVHPNASVRSKKIMQSLGLIAPNGSPFNIKIQHC